MSGTTKAEWARIETALALQSMDWYSSRLDALMKPEDDAAKQVHGRAYLFEFVVERRMDFEKCTVWAVVTLLEWVAESRGVT